MGSAHKTLDVRGMNGPLPVLKAKKAMMDVPTRGTLEVLATDPATIRGFAIFCKTTGATLLEQSESGGVYRFVIKNTG